MDGESDGILDVTLDWLLVCKIVGFPVGEVAFLSDGWFLGIPTGLTDPGISLDCGVVEQRVIKQAKFTGGDLLGLLVNDPDGLFVGELHVVLNGSLVEKVEEFSVG